jgi:hypothetical protein
VADVIIFPNPKWMRLEPLYVYDINCVVVYNFLDWAVPRPEYLSIFEHKWLDRIRGYRNRESYNYMKATRDFYDARVTLEIYGTAALPENVRRS